MASRRRTRAVQAWSALLRAHAAVVPVLDARMQTERGMPLGWYDVLLELGAAPEGRLRMSDLAERAVLSRTRVSRVVDELVGAGLATKESNLEDRRSTFAVVTDAGRARQRAAAPGYLADIEAHFADGLDDNDLAHLARILEHVATRPR